MDATLHKYASRPAPRYTSYPTAPHFAPDFPEAAYRDWLERLDPTQPISLYLHVPFCRQMCWYCGCNMKLAKRYAPVAAYVDTLLAEIALIAEALPAPMTVSHLHFGGGTPTALEPDDLARVVEAIHNRFTLHGDAEIALESDPRTLTAAMAARIGDLGFTRASFGIQEFDPKVQEAINRVQPPDMVRRAVDALRDAGVHGINFDLIYGLPHQTVASLARTVEVCAGMRPDRLALFGYAHVPWMAKNQRMIEEDALPGAGERAAQADAAAAALIASGYAPVGLDHFALPGDALALAARAGALRRNFQGYTTDTATTLIGMGATSIGRTPGGYVQNLPETGAWSRAVASGRLPVARGHALSPDDRVRGHVIERLMCDGAADLREAERAHGCVDHDWSDAFAALDELVRDGLVARTGETVQVTPHGRSLLRIAAAAFDRYHRTGATRHSRAV